MADREVLVREMIYYDIKTQQVYVRYDVCNKELIIYVEQVYEENLPMERYRFPALNALFNEIEKRDISLNDLITLPIPEGCKGQYVDMIREIRKSN